MTEEERIEIARGVLFDDLIRFRAAQAGLSSPKWAKNRRQAKRHFTKQVAKELNYSTWWMPFVWWLLSTAIQNLINNYLDEMFPNVG